MPEPSAMSNTFVKSFTHLKDKPKPERALAMLQRIASLVKPIMRKRGWVLPVLSEFFPESPNLLGLNVNHGQKILVRLRPAWAPDTFYDEEDVVGTMLHELTHNVHGPHDEKFYKYLSELENEYDALKRSGYAGEGFHSKGRRVGENASHDLPPHLARAKALEAAEKRRRTSAVVGSGGRLGGAATNLTPRELAARAAERRMRDEKACGQGQTAIDEATKAAKSSVENKVIDLTDESGDAGYDSDVIIVDDAPVKSEHSARPGSSAKPSGDSVAAKAPCDLGAAPISRTARRPNVASAPSSTSPNTVRSTASSNTPTLAPGEWACTTCTLVNDALALQCAACLASRPRDRTAGWTCLTCGEEGMPHDFWTCRFCGTMKTES